LPKKESDMKHLLTTTALIALLGAAPAYAAEDAMQEKPTANDVVPDAGAQAPAAQPDAATQPDATTAPDSAAAPAEKMQDQAPATAEDQTPAATDEQPADTAATTPASPSETFVTVQTDQEFMVTSLIGASVYNAADENLGDINDLVIGESGQIEAVIIGVGGFLGIGEKNVGIAFSTLNKSADQDGNVKFTLDVSKEELDQAPAFVTLVEKQRMESQPPAEPQLAPAPEPAPAPAPEPAPAQ
jgi:hypothetical protein